MLRVYFVALVGATIFLSYFMGAHVANIKCGERVATTIAEQSAINNNLLENTNETVFHTSVGDIRSVLHEKYTIAE